MFTDPDQTPPPERPPDFHQAPDIDQPPGPSLDDDRPGVPGMLGVAAVVVLGVLCCAGPALIAAGVLGVVGSWLSSPWLIAAAVLLALAATAWALRRRSARGRSDQDCCPPAGHTHPATAEHPPTDRHPGATGADTPHQERLR